MAEMLTHAPAASRAGEGRTVTRRRHIVNGIQIHAKTTARVSALGQIRFRVHARPGGPDLCAVRQDHTATGALILVTMEVSVVAVDMMHIYALGAAMAGQETLALIRCRIVPGTRTFAPTGRVQAQNATTIRAAALMVGAEQTVMSRTTARQRRASTTRNALRNRTAIHSPVATPSPGWRWSHAHLVGWGTLVVIVTKTKSGGGFGSDSTQHRNGSGDSGLT